MGAAAGIWVRSITKASVCKSLLTLLPLMTMGWLGVVAVVVGKMVRTSSLVWLGRALTKVCSWSIRAPSGSEEVPQFRIDPFVMMEIPGGIVAVTMLASSSELSMRVAEMAWVLEVLDMVCECTEPGEQGSEASSAPVRLMVYVAVAAVLLLSVAVTVKLSDSVCLALSRSIASESEE